MSKPLDLNDLRYFAAIIDAGSLSRASRALGVTKSLLSQHLSRLEETLGVSLIQRTTRRMDVTALGLEFHARCLSVLAEVERAQSVVEEARSVPRGTLKISCPVLFAQAVLMPVVNSFLRAYPEVDVVLDADYREVDLLGEGYDLALKIQRQLDDSRFIVRSFRLDQHWLVASPDIARWLGPVRRPADLNGCASAFLRNEGETLAGTVWQVLDSSQGVHSIAHHPRLSSKRSAGAAAGRSGRHRRGTAAREPVPARGGGRTAGAAAAAVPRRHDVPARRVSLAPGPEPGGALFPRSPRPAPPAAVARDDRTRRNLTRKKTAGPAAGGFRAQLRESGDQPPNTSLPCITAQWPGNEQKKV